MPIAECGTPMGARVADLLVKTFTEVDGGALLTHMLCSGQVVTREECDAVRQGRGAAVERYFRPREFLTARGIVLLYALLLEIPTYQSHMKVFRDVVRQDFNVVLL